MIDFFIQIYPVALLSLKVAMCATFINSIFAIGCAYLFAKFRFWGRNFLDKILTLPMVMPPTVIGYYLIVLIGRNGFVGHWLETQFNLRLIFTWQGAVIAAMVVTFPLIYKPARAAFENVPVQYEQAARVLGLSEKSIFWRISFPLARSGIIVGLLLAFARALGEFGATLMVAGSIPGKTETLSIAIYEAVQAGEDNLANKLVLLISFICIGILWIADRFSQGKHSANI